MPVTEFATQLKGLARSIEPMDELAPLLTAQQLAAYLNVPLATLYAWRYRREGPPGFRVGRHLRYRVADVEQWIQSQGEPDGRHGRPVLRG